MKEQTKACLEMAMDYCDENDKSTEFMLQYMQDVCGVDLDCVINFLEEHAKNQETKNDKNPHENN